MRANFAALAALAGTIAACSLLVDRGAEQCSSDGDCESRGEAFRGAICTADHTCLIREGDDGGGTTDAPIDAPPDMFVPECLTNQECTDRATAEGPLDAVAADADAAGPIAAVCVKPQYKCARLDSPDCKHLTGPYLDDNAVLFGTLLSTVGAQSVTNLARQQSAQMAVEEFNIVGGLPAATAGGPRRPMVLVGCDVATNLVRASTHLVNELHVPAVVGPNTSQDVIDTAQKVAVAGGTLLMSPAAVASSLADIDDNNLVWRLIPSDTQRAPLMIQQINELETQLKAQRGKTKLKLAIIYKDDAFGNATFNSLSPLKFNGDSLSSAANVDFVKPAKYDFTKADQSALVATYHDFGPDIVALIGTGEAVTTILTPLESAWEDATDGPRPMYVATDASKNSTTLNAVNGNESLRVRIRGTGVTAQATSIPVYNAFSLTYESRFGSPANESGMGPSYDAIYAFGYAVAAMRDQPVTGSNIAIGFRSLSNGATVLDVGQPKILAAFQLLTDKQKVSVNGTFGPFEWDSKGDSLGTIEMWCINSGTPAFASSGLTLNTKTNQTLGAYAQCP
jgi:branched-chain amino acid transport system substrate-binding protein